MNEDIEVVVIAAGERHRLWKIKSVVAERSSSNDAFFFAAQENLSLAVAINITSNDEIKIAIGR